MIAYIVRRLLAFIPAWFGVFLLTFLIFHVHDPLTLAAVQAPQAPRERLQQWVREHNYHLPLFLNLPRHAQEERPDGRVHPEFADEGLFYSQFFLHLRSFFLFEFGLDRRERPALETLGERVGPTLGLMLPAFVISVALSAWIALAAAYFRGAPFDRGALTLSTILMSAPLPVYILAASSIFGDWLRILPIYNHVLPPMLIAIAANLGAQIRFYRTVFLEETLRDYVRTARSRGSGEARILYRHVLRNSLTPIFTQISFSIPYLVTGSLLLEQFFGIPGMGDLLYSAIASQDFAIIKALVYIGALVYMLSALAADLASAWADPRIRLAGR